MKRILFIVSRKQPDLVERLEQECREGNIQIIIDRRVDERRQRLEPAPYPDRRHSERRIFANSSDLEMIGLAVAVVS